MGLPTPYYQDEWATIYHADCREVLAEMDKAGLILTDPPYALDFKYENYHDSLENLFAIIKEVFPLLKADRICISSGISRYRLWPSADWICAAFWDTTGSHGACGFSQWFPILFYGKDVPGFGTINGQLKADVFRVTGGADVGFRRTPSEKNHVCPKPFKLWSRILNRFSLPTDLILDPFMGSGTTLRAAKDLNRKSIGIEISERYCEIAVQRLQQEVLDFSETAE